MYPATLGFSLADLNQDVKAFGISSSIQRRVSDSSYPSGRHSLEIIRLFHPQRECKKSKGYPSKRAAGHLPVRRPILCISAVVFTLLKKIGQFWQSARVSYHDSLLRGILPYSPSPQVQTRWLQVPTPVRWPPAQDLTPVRWLPVQDLMTVHWPQVQDLMTVRWPPAQDPMLPHWLQEQDPMPVR